MADRKLTVFLCHASQDKSIVRDLYRQLLATSWIDPWLDEEKLLPGQDWDLEIEKAVEASQAVIVCLSSRSVSKEGYVQKELRKVLDIALEKPEETIFIIPMRLDECELPRRLRAWHYVDYFPPERRAWAFQRLTESLRVRFNQAGLPAKSHANGAGPAPVLSRIEAPAPASRQPTGLAGREQAETNILDVAGSLFLLAYLMVVALAYLGDTSDFLDLAKGVLAFGAGLLILLQRRFPAARLFRIAFTVFLVFRPLAHYLEYTGEEIEIAWPILGLLALATAGTLVAAIRGPAGKKAYSSLLIAAYLFLVVLEVILQSLGIYGSSILLASILLSVITSVLLWMDL
ncbi:MAG TPA: toll/interleukin-1 receptor domain-containing protein [Anaerolineales bacterium]|nr:toll/interleukin-1 receptor domain-containing protein [Anaerolineales bacterium]